VDVRGVRERHDSCTLSHTIVCGDVASAICYDTGMGAEMVAVALSAQPSQSTRLRVRTLAAIARRSHPAGVGVYLSLDSDAEIDRWIVEAYTREPPADATVANAAAQALIAAERW
jgi:hypothetical protein